MAIDFPNSPALGSTHTAAESTWSWDGTAWNLVRIPAVSGPTGPSGPSGPSGPAGVTGATGATGTVSPQGYTLINSITASGSTINFSSLSGYNTYLLLWSEVILASGRAYMSIKPNNDATNVTGSYFVSISNGTISTFSPTGGLNIASVTMDYNFPSAGWITIDGADTSSKKTFYGTMGGSWQSGASFGFGTIAGAYNSTSTISSINISLNTGGFGGQGTFTLWGK